MCFRFSFAAVFALVLIATAVRLGQSVDNAVKDPDLRKELLRRKKEDQAVRFEMLKVFQQSKIVPGQPIKDAKVLAKFVKIQAKVKRIDSANRKWLKSIITKHGWPGKSLAGKDGAHAAWLMVQHADADRAFQKHCLALMKKMPSGEVDKKSVAYLTDRILVGEKKKQIYGTQLATDAKGELQPCPIKDRANVDKRRKEAGLQPLAEYLEFARKQMKKKR